MSARGDGEVASGAAGKDNLFEGARERKEK